MRCMRCGNETDGVETSPGTTSAICDRCNDDEAPATRPKARQPRGTAPQHSAVNPPPAADSDKGKPARSADVPPV
jgi:recombinational DNA repair protein (RecF pathway)